VGWPLTAVNSGWVREDAIPFDVMKQCCA